MASPEISVIVPTYNRAEALRRTLFQLAAQRTNSPDFEVIVSDDGSSDHSASVVESFAGAMPLRYRFQEDIGNRVAIARNAGARMANAPILVFLDSGTLPGPGFVRHHFIEHTSQPTRKALTGYTYGYNPDRPMPGLADAMEQYSPEEVVRRYGHSPEFLDPRESSFPGRSQEGSLAPSSEPSSSPIPWTNFWSMNCSVHADDFWAVGGFYEGHRGWAVEDIDLGYRLFRNGIQINFGRAPWVVEFPHQRNLERNLEKEEIKTNMGRFLSRHPDPAIEIGWALISGVLVPNGRQKEIVPDGRQKGNWIAEYDHLLHYSSEVRNLNVEDEIRVALQRESPGSGQPTVAIIGAGGSVPKALPPAILIDFDENLLSSALRIGNHVGYHLIGFRTPMADKSVDMVVITSRLAGVWARWGNQILAEAQRVGREVVCCAA